MGMGARHGRYRTPALIALAVSILATTARGSTADHGAYEVLRQEFRTGPEVTRACLSCHVEAARQVMDTIHWTWVCPRSLDLGQKLGKVHVINNFCIGLPSNEPRCTSCHAGYGWKDGSFDFTDESLVDCLVCHDGTGTYEKFPTAAGHPAYEARTFGGRVWQPPDLTRIAQSVGRPTRDNCGACHFYGGGGEGVKHADLDLSLFHPTRELDVHMDENGPDFVCQDCHTTRDHAIAGRCYAVPATESPTFTFPRRNDDDHIYCQSCHGNAPHGWATINDHLDRVSCQACHIPRSARGKATKYWWDWSQAGRMDEDGKPYRVEDDDGNVTYDSRKGEFRWGRNTVPEYVWFDGSAVSTLLKDTIDDSRPVAINRLQGSPGDPGARIWPVKVHRGKQPYDPVNRRLVVPKLFGPRGSGAYWSDFDWDASVAAGMEAVGLPFSGEVGFVETEMYWPITHMIAPKERAVGCTECHSRGGRLAAIGELYLPRRDRSRWLDRLGWIGVGLTAGGVAVHGGLRAALARRRQAASERDEEA
jgi:octaheme c-type cytochrome (tetrathionate reductase family)